MLLWRHFKIRKTCSGVFFDKIVRLQSTACYRTKTSTTNTFLKLLRKERMFSNFEKLIENILFYRFKSRISDLNKKGIHAKDFLLVFWKVARKRYIIKPFNRVTGLLPRIHVCKKFPTLYLFKGCSEKLIFWKFWDIPRKSSWVKILLSGSSCLTYVLLT